MIGIVVPAHNEESYIAAALGALQLAAAHPDLAGENVRIVVVLDSCGDNTGAIAAACGVEVMALNVRNVGAVRAAGASLLLAAGARWLAFTDADTVVSPEWLVRQLEQGADAVCGSIGVADWRIHGTQADALRDDFLRSYRDVDGHRHIHGANLGVSAAAYVRAGGFQPLACSEDVALVRALEASGARIAWSAAPRVATSARIDARARGGFGDAILAVLTAGLAAATLQAAE